MREEMNAFNDCLEYISKNTGFSMKKPGTFFARLLSLEKTHVVFEPLEQKRMRVRKENAIGDPFLAYIGDLQGFYQVDLIPIVTPFFQDCYCLGWLIHQQCYVIWKRDSLDFIAFPGLTWAKICIEPEQIFYFDHFYAQGKSKLNPFWLKMWLMFPFIVPDVKLTVEPFPRVCPLHQRNNILCPRRYFDEVYSLTQQGKEHRTHLIWQKRNQDGELMIRRNFLDYLVARSATFPNSAVLNEHGNAYYLCTECENVKYDWLKNMRQVEEAMIVVVQRDQAVDCPHCRFSFDHYDSTNYGYGRHIACGQKLILDHR